MAYLTGQDAKSFDIRGFFEKQALEYPKTGTNAGVAVYSDDSLQYRGNVGCHGYMAGFIHHGMYDNKYTGEKKTELKELYTSTWSHDYSDTVLEYFRFLCNKQYSPWRSILKGSEVLWGKKDGKDIPIAVKLTDMTVSGQTVMNFMLALRMAYAQPGLIKSYGELRKAGFNRTESVFLSASFGLNKSNALNWPYIGDYPYDTAFTDMDWEAWKAGKPKCYAGGELNKERNTSPINAIWNENSNITSGIVVADGGKKNNRICDLISEEKEITNIFGNKEMRRYPLPFDQAVAKLKANEEIWKCKPAHVSTSQAGTKAGKTPSNWTNYSLDTDTWLYAPVTNSSTLSYFTVGTSV